MTCQSGSSLADFRAKFSPSLPRLSKHPQSTCSVVETQIMGGAIPGEMLIIYQDAFTHFDHANCGMISTKMLGQLLRFVGENPSDAEVQVRL